MSASTFRTQFMTGGSTAPWFMDRLAEWTLSVMFIAALLVPGQILSSGLPYFRPEQLLLIPIFFGYLYLLLIGCARPIRLNALMAVGAFYGIAVLISIWYGSQILGQQIILRDFYEFPKILLGVTYFTLAYEAELGEDSLRRIFLRFTLALIPICLYGWAQWLGIPFTYKLDAIYSGGFHVDMALERYRRVFSTEGNPNVLAQLLCWSICGLIMAVHSKVGTRARNLAILAMCLITIVMTGSRYGMLNLFFALIFIHLLPSANRTKRMKQLGILLLVLPLVAVTYQVTASFNTQTLDRFKTLENPLAADSLRARLDELWPVATKDIAQSPIFGRGPAKTIYSEVVHVGGYQSSLRTALDTIVTDSEHLDVLKEFGFFGWTIYLGFFLVPMYLILRGFRASFRTGIDPEHGAPASFLTLRLGLLMTVTALIMNIGMSTFNNWVHQGIVWMYLGLACNVAKRFEEAAERATWRNQTPSTATLTAFSGVRRSL